MNKVLLNILFLFISFSLFSQGDKKLDKYTLWKKEKESIEYQKNKKFKGPTDWYNEKPASILEKNKEINDLPCDGIKYDPQKIKRNRKKELSNLDEKGGGDFNPEPEIETPESDELTEEENKKKSKPFRFSKNFLIVLGICLLLGLVILIVYSILKNKIPNNKKIDNLSSEDFWNPKEISKTELELLLETAINNENYRECIRIYFTFILKEIIKKGFIKWKQEKTNYDYILEMKKNVSSAKFEECVRIYDLVWYGEYEIDKVNYDSIQPILLKYIMELQGSTINDKSSK